MLTGINAAGPVGLRIRRVVQHNTVLRAAKWFAGATTSMPPAIQEMRLPGGGIQPVVDASLVQICILFIDLQDQRHRADYDFGSSFSRTEAGRWIDKAQVAIASLRSLEVRDDSLIFLIGCVLGDALTRNA